MRLRNLSILPKLIRIRWIPAIGTILILAFTSPVTEPPSAEDQYKKDSILYRIHTTKASLDNLLRQYGSDFQEGRGYIKELEEIKKSYLAGQHIDQHAGINEAYHRLLHLQKKALLSSPVIDFDEILLVNRKIDLRDWDRLIQKAKIVRFGFPSNHECNSSLPKEWF